MVYCTMCVYAVLPREDIIISEVQQLYFWIPILAPKNYRNNLMM